MSKNKLKKFAAISTFPNVYENFTHDNPQLVGVDGTIVDLKGQWAKKHFKNNLSAEQAGNPITLELACGKGHYTLGLARQYPNRNFIGVDIKGARIWKGAATALEENLTNVAFLRTRIEQINSFFEKDEIDEIWITFPDPFLKKENRRLTGSRFLERYRKILKEDGVVHLKTDSDELFEFTMEVLENEKEVTIQYQDNDIYAKPLPMPELDIKTYYELMHLAIGKTIKYVRFKLTS